MGQQESTRPERSPFTLDDLTRDLVWPTLLRATALALAPGRMLIGVAAVVFVWALAWAFDRALHTAGAEAVALPLVEGFVAGLSGAAWHAAEGRVGSAFAALAQAFIEAPAEAVRHRPVLTAVIACLLVPLWMLCFGAAARSVAVDVAAGLHLTVREAWGFAWQRRRSLVMSAMVPIAGIILLTVALQAVGWLLLNLPGVNVAGGIVYGVMLLVGLTLVMVFLGLIAAHAWLAPAVAADASDWVDAVQRAYAYLFGRPGRAAVYVALALVQWGVVYLVGRWIVEHALEWTRLLTTDWLSAPRAEALAPATADGASSVAGGLMAFWEALLRTFFAGFMASYWFTAGTLVYLLLRRLNDEQDIREVWMPGLIEGTRAADSP